MHIVRIYNILILCVIVLFLSIRLSHADISQGLIGWWDFEFPSNQTVIDLTGSYPGTLSAINPDNSQWVQGIFGQALQLNGIDQFVTLPSALNNTLDINKSYTISLWFKIVSRSVTSTFINYATSSTNRNGIAIHASGTINAGHYDLTNFTGLTTYASANFENKWHHIALTNQQGQMAFYLDGQSIKNTGNYTWIFGSDNGVFLGRSNATTLFKGSLDEIRIYNRALTPSEINELFTYQGLPPGEFDVFTSLANNISDTSVTLNGSLVFSGNNKPTVRGFEYGLNSDYGQLISSTGSFNPGLFSENIDGLNSNTTYHYRSFAIHPQGTVKGPDMTFTTLPAVEPIKISNINPQGTLPAWSYYTTLSFITNKNATCKFSLNPNDSFNSISDSLASPMGTSHQFPLLNLSDNTNYQYYIFCKDEVGKFSSPQTATFSIAQDDSIPNVENISSTFIYFDTAIIQWATTKPSGSLFEYGETPALGTLTVEDYSLAIPHAMTLTNLKPSTTYYYQITSTDKKGHRIKSPIQSFTTLATTYAKEFFVSLNGSDANDGSITKPFASIEKALTAVQSWRTAQGTILAPIVIWLRGGTYFKNTFLYLTSTGSGTEQSPTIISAYDNEKVVWTGGKEIVGFSRTTDPTRLNRLLPDARNNIYEINLGSVGIADYGSLSKLPPNGYAPMELFWNNERMTLARYPNKDYLNITSIDLSSPKVTLGYGTDPEPARWTSNNDIWTHGWFHYDWFDYNQNVDQINPNNHTFSLNPPNPSYGYALGNDITNAGWFYFMNVFDAIDSPGEYYIDRSTGTLYFWPPSDISKGTAEVSLSAQPFIRTYGASYIIIQNITFKNNRTSAISFQDLSHHLSLVNVDIYNIGSSGLLSLKTDSCGIYHSRIHDVGSYGISLYNTDDPQLMKGHNFALSNEVVRTGRWIVTDFGGPPINISGTNGYIAHNEIHDQIYLGIDFHGINHVIEMNDVYDVMQYANDGAGIYTWPSDILQRGSIVKFNYVHDYLGTPGKNSANGIYLDEFTSGVTIYGNIISNISPGRSQRGGGSLMIAAGRNNIIQNNIIVTGDPGVFEGAWGNLGSKLSILSTGQQNNTPFKTYFPELSNLNVNSPTNPEGSRIINNIFYNITGPWFRNYGDSNYDSWVSLKGPWEPYIDIRNNLINIDPLFVDYSNNNFNLRDNSPAYSLGFKRIPINTIGLLKSSSSTPVFYGDVSGDNHITLYDATLVAQHYLGIRNLTGDAFSKADVNNDGQITMSDANLIAEYALGLISKFPAK